MTVFLKSQGPGRAIAFLAASTLLSGISGSAVRAAGVSITSYGHSALLIRGGGQSVLVNPCLLYTSPSPRDSDSSRMPSSA